MDMDRNVYVHEGTSIMLAINELWNTGRAHNPKVLGSSPSPATEKKPGQK